MEEKRKPREIICKCGNKFKTFSEVREECYKCNPISKNKIPREEKGFSIVTMFKEAELGLAKFRNIIGIGVIVFLLVFSMVFGYTYYRERQIAEHCGFENEKIKCVCTKNAWDVFNNRYGISLPILEEGLNSNMTVEPKNEVG